MKKEDTIKQAISENWSRTIDFWCETLQLGRKESKNLKDYHREYLDLNSRKRIGVPVHSGKHSPWLLNYNEFQILRGYRASRGIRGRPFGAKDSFKRDVSKSLGIIKSPFGRRGKKK